MRTAERGFETNAQQRTDYDPHVRTSWTFYYYLATTRAVVRLTDRKAA